MNRNSKIAFNCICIVGMATSSKHVNIILDFQNRFSDQVILLIPTSHCNKEGTMLNRLLGQMTSQPRCIKLETQLKGKVYNCNNWNCMIIINKTEFLGHICVLKHHLMLIKGLVNQDPTTRSMTVKIPEQTLSVDSVKRLLSLVYKNEYCLDESTVFKDLLAANYFQFTKLQKACVKFIIQKTTIQNCLDIYFELEGKMLLSVVPKIHKMVFGMFHEVTDAPQFLQLPKNKLYHYLSHAELCVESELYVYKAAMKWMKANKKVTFLNSFTQNTLNFHDITIDDMCELIVDTHAKNDSIIVKLLQTISELKRKVLKRIWESEEPPAESSMDIPASGEPIAKMDATATVAATATTTTTATDTIPTVAATTNTTTTATTSTTTLIINSTSTNNKSNKESVEKHAADLMSMQRRHKLALPVLIVQRPSGTRFHSPVYTASFEAYNFRNQKFIHLDTLSNAITNLGVGGNYQICTVGTKLYVIGCWFKTSDEKDHLNGCNKIWSYSVLSSAWSFECMMPEARWSFSCCIGNNTIYTAGGTVILGSIISKTDLFEKYETTSRTWFRLQPLPELCSDPTMGFYDSRVLAILNGHIHIYIPNADLWAPIACSPSLHQFPYFHSIILYDDTLIHLFAGNDIYLMKMPEDETKQAEVRHATRFSGPSTRRAVAFNPDFILMFADTTVFSYEPLTKTVIQHEHNFPYTSKLLHGLTLLPFVQPLSPPIHEPPIVCTDKGFSKQPEEMKDMLKKLQDSSYYKLS